MKAIILGSPLIGKSTLVEYLRGNTALSILELDEEIIKINNGVWPDNGNFRNKVIVPKVIKNILNKNNAVFFTSYFGIKALKAAKEKRFRIIQLNLSKNNLLKRNKERIQSGIADARQAIEDNILFQNEIRRRRLIDKSIDVENKFVSVIAEEITKFLGV